MLDVPSNESLLNGTVVASLHVSNGTLIPSSGFLSGMLSSYFQLAGSLAKATRLSAVAMQESGSDVIEVRTTRLPDHLEVLRNQQVLSFSEQSWMDLKGTSFQL